MAEVAHPEHHFLVCINQRPPGNPKGSCGQKGSEELADQLKAMVKEKGLGDRVMVSRTSCLKHCSRGITVAVYPEGAWYGGVGPADLPELIDSLATGHPIERLAMPDIPWE